MKYILTLIISIAIFSCIGSKKATVENYTERITPPGTIYLGGGLYCDNAEMENQSWNEFLYWTMRTFYADSPQVYRRALPDTLVWRQRDTYNESFVDYYLKHPAYRDYPVVGISHKQAIDFSKWRSDRVMEMLLNSIGELQYDSIIHLQQDKSFTIERYFNNELEYLPYNPKIKYYPYYYLPSYEERRIMRQYSDSTMKSFVEKYSKKRWYKRILPSGEISPYSIEDVMEDYESHKRVDSTAKYQPCPDVANGIPYVGINQIYGNMAEWSNIDSIAFGGGWIHTDEQILSNDTNHVHHPNAWTGMRNVFRWKKWEGVEEFRKNWK